jgi:hypothetical protein
MLTFIKETGFRQTPSGSKRRVGLFKCHCGNIKEVCLYNVKAGIAESCGCKGKEQIRQLGLNNKHTYRHGFFGTRFYSIYYSMKARCSANSISNCKYYSDKGIKLLWNSFDEFREDMYKSYTSHVEKFGEKNTTLDRINSHKHYCKENCRWATYQEQAKEKRKIIIYNNKNWTLQDLARKYKMSPTTLNARIKRGWDLERALITRVESRTRR